MKAVILAAGNSSRFKEEGVVPPKPLIHLGGLSLLERAARSCAKAGVSEIVAVIGAGGPVIRQTLEPRLAGLPLRWVENPDWQRGNGTSVLAAAPWLGEEPFLVIMADHLLFPATLKRLIDAPRPAAATLMAVDKKRDLIADPADATKVRLANDRIVEIGKSLETYDAFDVGAAVCSAEFLSALRRQAGSGACAHTDGMKALAGQGLLLAHDIGPDRWEDVDSSPSLRAAERILLRSLRKPADGFLSKHLERHLSLAVTRRIMNTPVTPNQMTLGVVALGAAAAGLFAQEGDASKTAGALLFWCASFLDGCDGELARLKFAESRWGGWLDLWSDNVVHGMVFIGMGVGLWRDTGNRLWPALGIAAALGVLFSVSWVSVMTLKGSRGSGPLYTSVAGGGRGGRRPAWLARLIALADAMSRRDFIFGVIFVTLLGWLPGFLWVAAIGSHLYFLVLIAIHVALRSR